MVAGIPFGVRHHDCLKRRQAIADLAHLGDVGAVGDEHLRRRIAKPPGERINPELGEQRHRDRSHPVERDVRQRRLGPLAEQDADAVAAADAQVREGIRELVGKPRQLTEGVAPHLARRPLIDHRQGIGPLGVQGIPAEVAARRHLMAELRPELFVARSWSQKTHVRAPPSVPHSRASLQRSAPRRGVRAAVGSDPGSCRPLSRQSSWSPLPCCRTALLA